MSTNNYDLSTSYEIVKSSWEEVFPGTTIEDGSNFFLLGGDSMLGMIVMLSISEQTKSEFTLNELYSNPLFAALVDYIDGSISVSNSCIMD